MIDIASTLQALLAEKDWKTVKRELGALDPIRLAEVIDALPKEDRIVLFRIVPREPAKETFQRLSRDAQEEIIEGLAANARQLTALLGDLDPDDRTAFFEELPGEVAQRLMQMLPAEERESAARLTRTEILWSMLSPESDYPARELAEAWKNVLLFSEHTWGASASGPGLNCTIA